MRNFPITHQHDSMQCGIACLQMVCKYFGRNYSLRAISSICFATNEGVSLLGIAEAADMLGLHTVSGRLSVEQLAECPLPCILHWNQNHFVVLYKVKDGKKFYIADPGKGRICYSVEEMTEHWIATRSICDGKGIAMLIETTPKFFEFDFKEYQYARDGESHSFFFIYKYAKKYRKQFLLIILGLIVGSLLQLVLPYLTQSIVDVGIKGKDIDFVWLVLLGQLMITVSRTAIDFVRRWVLLRISMRVNISLVSDFFVKLLKLPMSFFDTKLTGDLMQRMNDHARVNSFLTQKALSVTFSIVYYLFLLLLHKVTTSGCGIRPIFP